MTKHSKNYKYKIKSSIDSDWRFCNFRTQNWAGPPIPILAISASIYKKFLILSSKYATAKTAPRKIPRSLYWFILCWRKVVMFGYSQSFNDKYVLLIGFAVFLTIGFLPATADFWNWLKSIILAMNWKLYICLNYIFNL